MEKLPDYTITNLILNYTVKYELSVKKILETPLPHSHRSQLYNKLKSEELIALGELIGEDIGFDKASKVQKGQLVSTSSSIEYKIFNNFRSTQGFIKSYNRDQFLPPSGQLITHLNKLLMNGIVEIWETAKFRGFAEKPNEIYDSWYLLRDHYPNIDNSVYFNSLMEWITSSKDTTHKLIQFAVLLFEFIDKAPMISGNQITALSTLSLLLKEYEYNPHNLLPVVKGISSLNEDFKEAFKMSKKDKNLTVFIEALLYIFSMEMTNLENQVINIYENKVEKKGKLSIELNERQIQILEYLQINQKITRRKYAKIMDISFMTAYRDLNELLDKGYIKQKGVGRGTFYVLDKDNEEVLKEIPTFVDLNVKL